MEVSTSLSNTSLGRTDRGLSVTLAAEDVARGAKTMRATRSVVRGSLLLALLAITSPAASQVRSPSRPAAAPPKWSELEKSVGSEDYAKAKEQAEAIIQRGAPEDRQKAAAVYGRILLALGQRDQARQYLDMLSKAGAGGELLVVYSAWLQALEKPVDGIKALETLLEKAGGAPDETTAEAADVLAMLYMGRGEQEKAKKAVDFGLKALEYRGVKSGYVLALLRGRLTSDIAAGEAKRLYNQAEKLRAEKKFIEAGQLFAQVRAAYPQNQWGHASGFRIGQCYVGLNRPAQAIDWWQKFIKESPAGPWRGQAHVALVDTVLQFQLDLAKATEHAMAAGNVLAKGLDKEAEPSWKEAAYDIYLRQGIVSLVDGRFDAAAQGFQQAKESAPKETSKEAQAGLDRLIETAQSRARLIPDELTVGDDRATTALALGNIYNVLRQYDAAKGFFALPLTGPMRSHSAAHRSFAGLGLARAVIGSGKTISSSSSKSSPQSSPQLQAKAIYEASLKEYPKGSWHDETLRELALLIERAAVEQFAPPPAEKTADKKGAEKPAVPMTDAARQQQKKALIAARAPALPYWTDLPARYPNSRHVPQALYHAGVLYSESEKPDESFAAFDQLVKKHPDSPWTGDAQVRLIDVKLEQQFDLPGAQQLADDAVAWYERLDTAKASKAFKESSNDEDAGLRTLKQVGYDIYVRAGLVEYLSEHNDRALEFFEKAKPLQPERNFVVVHGTIPTGIERLIDVAKSGKSLTPEIVRKGDEKARLILMLADVYLEAAEHEKARELATLVVDGPRGSSTVAQRSWAHRQRAVALSNLGMKPDAKLEYLSAQRTFPSAPWASQCLFMAGTIIYNDERRLQDAIGVFQEVVNRYPTSEFAAKAAYFVGVIYEWNRQWSLAKAAYQKVIRDYPESRWASAAMNHHLKKVDAALEAAKDSPIRTKPRGR